MVLHITRLVEQAKTGVFIRDLSPVLFSILHIDCLQKQLVWRLNMLNVMTPEALRYK